MGVGIVLFEQLKQSQTGQVASNAKEDMRREARVEVSYDRKLEQVFVSGINSPRLKAEI
jgi:hypothetical protein